MTLRDGFPKAVIFDVDGTLYDQPKLRRCMTGELLRYVLRSPLHGLRAVFVLTAFRRLREKLPELEVQNLAHVQYSMTAAKLGYPPEQIRSIVQEWMFRRPLRHLASCKLAGLDEFLGFLRERNVPAAVFSDYPARDKLQSLGLEFCLILDAEDPRIDRLKPDPKGLMLCLEQLGLSPAECLFVGDRDDRDGECARRCGMPYLLYNHSKPSSPKTFSSYSILLGRIAGNGPEHSK